MPKNGTREALAKEAKTAKSKKQKLSPERRSEIAKERWAKIKLAKEAQETPQAVENTFSSDGPITATSAVTLNTSSEADAPVPPLVFVELPPPAQDAPIVGRESATSSPTEALPDLVKILDETPDPLLESIRNLSTPHPVAVPAPQLAPVKPPKQKRTPVPKEFLVALKTADTRLAKAIEEYEDCQQRITYLSGAIPRLQRTVLALRNESNPDAPIPPYNFAGGTPNATAYQAHPPQYPAPLDAILNAQPAPPISRAQGGAVQFSPDVLGSLEGPEDDDDNPDKYITGPLAGGGWK